MLNVCMLDEDKNASNRNLTKFTIINCNTRSLCPKIESFIDCFNEMDAAIGVVSETWLSPETAKDVQERLSEESGIGLITRERRRPADNGVCYGVVGLAWRQSACSLKVF